MEDISLLSSESITYDVIIIGAGIAGLAASKVLKENGVINRIKDGIKLLGNGSINSKIEIEVTAASSSAKKAIEKVNGKISILLEIIKEESNGIKAKH